MSYPKKSIKMRPAQGIANDLPAFEVDENFYTTGRNVHFRLGFAGRSSGHAQVYPGTLATIRNLLNMQAAGVNYWLYFGISTIYAVTGSTHTNLTPGAGLLNATTPGMWTTGLLNGVPFANNGLDVPYYWTGDVGTDFVVLPGWPGGQTCKAMRAFKNHLFAMDITTAGGDFPMRIAWSAAAAAGTVPATWAAAATNEAGDTSLSATPGPIIDAEALRNALAVYKTHSAFTGEYVGGQNIYAFRPLSITAGALTRHCIANVKGAHFLVGDGDVVVSDGNSVTSIIDRRMRLFLFNQLDQTNYQSMFCVSHRRQNEVWIFFPSSGNTFCDLALVWDSAGGAWGVRDVPLVSHAALGIVNDTAPSETWDADTDTWDSDNTIWNQQGFSSAVDSLVLGVPNDAAPTSSLFLQVDLGDTFNGTNIQATIGKYSMALEAAERVKFVKRIIPLVKAGTGTELLVRVGTQMTAEGTITWGVEQTFIVGTSQYVDVLAMGKFISVEFRSTGVNPWTLTGFDIEGEVRGYH